MKKTNDSYLFELEKKIENKTINIGIIGLGYVGLPLMLGFAENGFKVVGFDIDSNKVELLNYGKSYIKHINEDIISKNINNKMIKATDDFTNISIVDVIILCVPTPLNKHREPDISYITKTMDNILPYIRKGQLISLESTTYPGTTEEEIASRIEEKKFIIGKNYFVVYSPEREDPGNKYFSTTKIPKVLGGITKNCSKIGAKFYSSTISQVVVVSSTKTAEMTKLLENIYRAVNIGLVNEMKLIADKMDIDIWEVINAASSKPFGFTPFYPGPGLGGHCIPIDPFYLTWKAREYDFHTKFIELAGEINTQMPYYVVQKTIEALNNIGISSNKAKILILGITYKKDIDDFRESPSFKLIEIFLKKGVSVDYNDPYAPRMPSSRKYCYEMYSVELTPENLSEYDCVLVSTDHSSYDYKFILENSKLVIDTRNAFKEVKSDKIIKA